jgi:tartrate-resistant acid phosphatase type 5
MKQSRRQFVRTLFVATQAAAIGALVPRSLFAAGAPAAGMNFLVFGDWGRKGQKDQLEVAVQMGVAAQAVSAQFVISVGDNFYENGVASVDDPHWQSSFEKVYTAPALQVPWWIILGNHDYHGNCDAQIEYHKVNPHWNMPARYFTRTEKIDAAHAVDFFYLDTTPMAMASDDKKVSADELKKQLLDRQMAWFEAALAASTAPWKIVVGHHPVYSGGVHGDTPYLVERVLPLLEKYQVQAYFNGHDHDLQHLQAGRVNMFCSGGGSKPRDLVMKTAHSKFGRGTGGFIAAALKAEALEVRMINDQGKQLYAATVPR